MPVGHGDILQFTRQKEYIFDKFIDKGGTGRTALLKDDILDMYFVCKKYEPSAGNDREDCFKRFVDEIKILYTLSHRNIVRIFSYFLYPQNYLGYILMEYIDGQNIDTYLMWEDDETFEKVFIQLIEGFEYLEKNNVLHRDIKEQNILITKDGTVKIIDFGFGKKVTAENKNNASILLNWPVSELPDEVAERKYNHKTDIYFLGKMFNKLLEKNGVDNFKYQHVIDLMVKTNPDKRINSFAEILNLISTDILGQLQFTEEDKKAYMDFADSLSSIIEAHKVSEPVYVQNIEEMIARLEHVISESLLETYIQNNSDLISCFIKSNCSYYPKKYVEVEVVKKFYKMIKGLSSNKRKIVQDNLFARLRTISIDIDDELPF